MANIFGFLLLAIVYLSTSAQGSDPLVTTHQGVIKGKIVNGAQKVTYKAFKGVPFAKPPIGALRFQAPEPPQSWKGVLDVSTNANKVCYSTTHKTGETEDCLYLNVYTPISSEVHKTSFPVMIWIHGGGYTHGGGFGPEYFLKEDIIVVSVNYRLGPLGFLSTGDTVIPGNAGHKDQAAAIKWVHDNIANFGGDPKKITIAGQSAGGSSVGYQLLYQGNKGLFRAAILQSGSALSPWSYISSSKAREFAFDLAKHINGSVNLGNDSKKLEKFLLTVHGDVINNAAAKTQIRTTLPTIEVNHNGAFMTAHQYDLLKNGNFIRVPIIIGTTSEEEIHQAGDLTALAKRLKSLETSPQNFIPKDFVLKNSSQAKVVGNSIKDLYLKGVPTDEQMGHVVRYYSHTAFTMAMIKYADLVAKYIDVHFYQFSYDGKMGGVNITIKGADKVDHTEDARYISSSSQDLSKFPKADVVTYNRLIKLWSNFIKNLNPTPNKTELLENLIWPKFIQKEFKYLDIDTNLKIKAKPKTPYYETWTKLYDEYAKQPFTTF